MARYQATVDTRSEPEAAFAYFSNFSTTEEWDPGVIEAERLEDAAIGEGTEFRLVTEFLSRKTTLTYRIVEYDPPHAVRFYGENHTVISNDKITFESLAPGTRVTYDAELVLKGPLRVADPVLGLAFKRVGDRARAGRRWNLGGERGTPRSARAGRARG